MLQKTECVDKHNILRRQESAADMSEMTWSEELGERAQELADTCVFAHALTTSCDGESIGQNLYIKSGGSFSASNAIQNWYDETTDYTFATRACTPGKMCGHYTQVVWADSTHVGCAKAFCPSLAVGDGTWSNAYLFVCNYGPAGNWRDQDPYTIGSPCSQCGNSLGHGGGKCDNGLCASCEPQSDRECTCLASDTSCSGQGLYNSGTCACECNSDYYGDSCENSCACEDAPGYSYSCSQWRDQYCSHPWYTAFMTEHCKSTCGFCATPAGTCGN